MEQNKYTTKIGNIYLVYDLHNWPKGPLRSFTLKSCLFGVTNIAKENDKVCIGSRSLNNDSARNVIIFGVHNSSSSHTHN